MIMWVQVEPPPMEPAKDDAAPAADAPAADAANDKSAETPAKPPADMDVD